MNWRDFEAEAPEIARLGKERLDRTRIALLGTLRANGFPRISPVEPYIVQGHLLLGLMSHSVKAGDLLRDPRCVLHSTVTGPDTAEGELKLYGRAQEVRNLELRAGRPDAWWTGRPPGVARVFSIDITEAVFISWDIALGQMTVRRWSPGLGVRTETRGYP